MRVLHIFDHSSPWPTGYALRSRALLEWQRALGLETFHLTSANHCGPQVLVEDVEGWRFFRTPAARYGLLRLPLLKSIARIDNLARRLDEVVEEVRPDLLHAHFPAPNGLAALRVAQWHDLPLVYECRAFWEDIAEGMGRREGLRYRIARVLEGYVLRRAQAITTQSLGLSAALRRRGIPAAKITVIPDSVDIHKFQSTAPSGSSVRETLGWAGNTVLGFIGSFQEHEGLPLLLDALPALVAQRPDLRLLLVGDGPQDGLLRERVQRLGLESQVAFMGRVSYPQIQKYYAQIDVLVYPRYATRFTERVPSLKVLEALAQGGLVVAAAVGGHRETLTDRDTAWLFQAGDREQLVRTLLDLLARPDLWPGLRQAGRQFIAREHSWQASAGRYLPLYQSLLAGKS